jgi:hypothetical protein
MLKEADITRLEARIVELENALKAVTALTQPVDLSADEIRAYLKVRDAISCEVCRCAFHCSCRLRCSCHIPCGLWRCERCDIGYSGTGGLGRFTDLGS